MRPRGLVLDFDGVLARSMELHAEAYRRVLEPLNVDVPVRDVFMREGARSESIIRDLCAHAGKPLDEAEVRRLANVKQEVYRGLGPPDLYPGAERLLDRLHATGFPLALVTGTRRENLTRLIPHLLDRFTAVLAQDAYTHDKPHPEPYLKAAHALRREPAQCAVLENALRGVQSAHAAGYGHIVAITTTLEAADFHDAPTHRIVATHEAAADELLAWAQRAP